jgi:hypothetical protein
MVYNERVKASIYKWREANPEQYQESVKASRKKYYDANRDKIVARNKARYHQTMAENAEALDDKITHLKESLRQLETLANSKVHIVSDDEQETKSVEEVEHKQTESLTSKQWNPKWVLENGIWKPDEQKIEKEN